MPATERREMVLEAAVAEFAARGLAGTSTEDVARRAKGFLALIGRCFDRVQDTFTTAAGDLTGDEALAAMADSYTRLLDDRTLLLLQMQIYAACSDPEIRDATMDLPSVDERWASWCPKDADDCPKG